jgi:hypothetical protein
MYFTKIYLGGELYNYFANPYFNKMIAKRSLIGETEGRKDQRSRQ